MKLRSPALALAIVLWAGNLSAQQAAPVTTLPSPVASANASSTITTTNTFQSIWAVQSFQQPRRGCLIVNTSTDRQWVYFGPIASATKATAFPLEPAAATAAAGGSISCSSGTAGSVLQDQVSITGTMGDTFVANQQ